MCRTTEGTARAPAILSGPYIKDKELNKPFSPNGFRTQTGRSVEISGEGLSDIFGHSGRVGVVGVRESDRDVRRTAYEGRRLIVGKRKMDELD